MQCTPHAKTSHSGPWTREDSMATNKRRPKVLCLGVSFPDLAAHLCSDESVATRTSANESVAPTTPLAVHARHVPHEATNVNAVIDAVRRGTLTQMDGRDLARCVATEEQCQVDVYGVSQEKGAIYRSDRHLEANFNRASFVQTLQKHFVGCQFDQIILDYFWIPAGWDTAHWRRPLFETTLVNLAKSMVLRSSPSRPTNTSHDASITNPTSYFHRLYRRGIYLPFCFHCFQAIVAHSAVLKKHYNISFLRKHELECLTLWSGTQQIDQRVMQHVLGKRTDQEEVYCTFGPRHLKEMNAGDSTTKELLQLASSLEDFADIRFILLEPVVRCTAVASVSATRGSARQRKRQTQTRPTGRFLGLVHPNKVQRGFRHIAVVADTAHGPGAVLESASSDLTRRKTAMSGSPPAVVTPLPSILAVSWSTPSRKRKRSSCSLVQKEDSVHRTSSAKALRSSLRLPSPTSVVLAVSSPEDKDVGRMTRRRTRDDPAAAELIPKTLFS